MVVPDGLAAFWRHGILNHRDNVAWSVYITSAQRNDMPYFYGMS